MKAWAVLALLVGCAAAHGDEKADKVAAQRKTAEAAWAKLDLGEAAFADTTHLLLVAPKASEGKLKDVGQTLEKFYDTAHKQLTDGKDEAWPGKLTVYLLPSQEAYNSFLRRVEMRRVDGDEPGSFDARDDKLHAAAGAPKDASDTIEGRAGQQVASAVLQRRAGVRTRLPSWLLTGFGRATFYRVAGASHKSVRAERQSAVKFATANKRMASDVWGGALEGEEGQVLSASVADFLAYGPGKARFAKLLDGFKPAEGVEVKTMAQAMQSAELEAKTINDAWAKWAVNPR